MLSKNKNQNLKSELRQDLISGEWVVIAPRRGKRPNTSFAEAQYKGDENKECIFCDPVKSEQEKDVLIYESNNEWLVRVFPNKYPAFQKGDLLDKRLEGSYFLENAIGFHEIIVTRDHTKHLALLDAKMVDLVLQAYEERYLKLMNKRFVDYISIFHNHGRKAGASIAHPHSQLIAMPVVSLDVQKELRGTEEYFNKYKECAMCKIVEQEIESEKRIIFQNNDFIVFCPFASRMGYEIWVVPRIHSPYFERMNRETSKEAARALQSALFGIYNLLNNIDYNFYLHTAPCDGRLYDHFHWHFEILPKCSAWAGFELGTGVEINPILPEVAALELRKTIQK